MDLESIEIISQEHFLLEGKNGSFTAYIGGVQFIMAPRFGLPQACDEA